MAAIQTDPFDIIKGGRDVGGEGFDLLGMYYLYSFLRKYAVIICAVALVLTLTSMLFVQKSEMVADKKKDVQLILFRIVILLSLATVYGWFKTFFDTLFYRG